MEDNNDYRKLNSSNKKKKFFHLDINKNDSSLKKFFFVLFSYIDFLIVLNLFLIIFSLGIITIGPVIFATSESIIKITNNNSEKLYSSYFKYFKKYFKLPYIIFGLILLILLAGSSYLSIFFFENIFDHQYLIVIWILMIFLVLYLIQTFSCFILFNINTTLPLKTCFTNGLKLSIGSIKHSLICSLSFILLFITPLIFLERTFILFIVIEFALTILACLLSNSSLVNKYIIYPCNENEIQNEIDKKEFNISINVQIENEKVIDNDDEPSYDYSNSDNEKVI